MGNAKLRLSVVDQSPLRQGGLADDALRESVRLAQIVEKLGYFRYWVAEHHNATSYACTSPELLIAQIAANTRTIRVGSGGVMLLNYSALKVAELFRVLNAFYPGRVDLGIGRATGGDPLASEALAHPRSRIDPNAFTQQLTDLLNYLHGTLEPDHQFAQVKAQPGRVPASSAEVWLLGSSIQSAALAARLGLPFAFADFLGSARKVGPEAARCYRQHFNPSRPLARPKLSVAIEVLCAPTEAEAIFLARSRNFDRVAEVFRLQGYLKPQDVSKQKITAEIQSCMTNWTESCIDGNPQQVRKKILKVARLYGTNDISVLTNCYAFEHRVRSYEILAEAFHLKQTAQ
jgi:luciferase family oxidoreductase group 1